MMSLARNLDERGRRTSACSLSAPKRSGLMTPAQNLDERSTELRRVLSVRPGAVA